MGIFAYDIDIDKDVNVDKTITLDVDKNIDVRVNVSGLLADAEAAADAFGPGGGGGGGGPLVQLAFLIDGSTSIDPPDFALQTQGVAEAVRGIATFPVEVTVIQFADGAAVEVGPVLINDSTQANDVADDIALIAQDFGGTNTAAAINLAVSELLGSPNFEPGNITLINLSTDGNPTLPPPEANARAEAANAATNAQVMGITGISVEAVGPSPDVTYLNDFIAYPDPSEIVMDPANLPDPTMTGFVLEVESFEDFGPALEAKLQEIIPPAAGLLAETETLAQVDATGDFPFAEAYSQSIAASSGADVSILLG